MKSRYATKKPGKTEVYPFWNLEDIKGMMDYFRDNKQWNNYTTFIFGLLLGRRVGDTLAMRWSDLFYPNGKIKDEITTIEEEKTGKTVTIPICGAVKETVEFYLDKTKVDPANDLNDFIFPFRKKTEWRNNAQLEIYSGYTTDDMCCINIIDKWCKYFNKDFGEKRKEKILNDWQKSKKEYDTIENFLYYEVEFKNVIKSQSEMYRRDFKAASDYCGIKYPVSTHSTRKTFGYWSKQIHPYDVDCMEILQDVFAHSDIKTTMKYIGLTAQRKKKYFDDMGDLVNKISEGDMEIVKNAPVISIKASDLRDILVSAIRNIEDEEPLVLMSQLMETVESLRVS